MKRVGKIKRETLETNIELELNLDGKGVGQIETPVPFLNHMLHSFTKHGLFDLKIVASGDIWIDDHHTVEDIGIVLGQAFDKAVADKQGMKRFASNIIPLDDALILCAVDVGGRPYLQFDVDLPFGKVGNFDTQLVQEFFIGFVNNAKINLHVKKLSGNNVHHIIEALFKAIGRTLDEATFIDQRIEGVLSTKGVV